MLKRILLIACTVLSLSACKKTGASEVHMAASDEIVIAASKAAEATMEGMVVEGEISGISETVPLADRKRYFQQSQIYGFGELCKMGTPKVTAREFVLNDLSAKKWTAAQVIFIATLMKMNQELMIKNLAGYECGPDVVNDLKPYYN